MYRKLLFGACLALVLCLSLTVPTRAELIAWWRLDDGSGTTAMDSSGNGYDGTVEGGAQWVDGKLGGALSFNGSNSLVRAPHIPLDSRTFTITMWVYPDLYTSEQIIFSQRQSSATDTDMHFRIYGPGSGRVRMGFYNNDLDTTMTLDENNWYHITFWYDFDNQTRRIYIDGNLDAEASATPYLGTSGDTVIGSWAGASQWFQGIIDDVQIYDHALTDSEILAVMQGLEGYPYPSSPSPEDGSLHPNTWVSLSWRAGDFAVSHDVYFGESFDDVNDATRDSEVFRGNQGLGTEFYIAGFPPYAYPEGLVNGVTYYWRIDEVNDADPNSPWKGKVWSFTVPPKTAYNPVPTDNAAFIDADNPTLSWTPGFGSKLHFIYFGDDFDTVANASGAPPTAQTTYNPGPLELEKTYYWRIDESDGVNTFMGDVWSFKTAKAGGGLKGEYFNNTDLSGVPVLIRMDPQIDVYWNPGPVGPGVSEDNFSVRWTGELEASFSEPFTFIVGCDDGARMYLNGELIINDWGGGHDYTEFRSQPLDLVAGEYYSIVVEGFELSGEAEWRLFWQSASMARQNVPQAALSPPVKASSPSPPSGATGTKMTPILRWGAGDYAASHEVYFGTDADVVANADKSSPEYKGIKALSDESYDPGKLAWFTQYFWRIDEVNNLNPDSPWIGNLWSFTTGDFLVIDDFEDYDSGDNQIWFAWHDGLGAGAQDMPNYIPGNGTGSAVGDETTLSYTEETIVHSGSQSMPLEFNNNKQGFANYSEAELTLTATRDWTEEGVANLSLWFRGYPASTGSFVEGPVGTYTMTGSGADIWNQADEFHYAYKTLTGVGSIVARVESVDPTNNWAKAGVMIRETLEPGSKHAMTVVTPAQGVSFQRRVETDNTSSNTDVTGLVAPYWVKIERDLAGNFTGSHSANGSTWEIIGVWENIQMAANVYIGLAVTSHDAALTCQAVFTNITTTGNITGQWTNQDIGILSNDAESLYVAVSNSTGTPAVVVHDDPATAQIDIWTEWIIPLQDLADQGIILTDVDRIAIGLGTKGNMTIPGGKGKMFIDDIRLYQPATEPEPEQQP